MRILITGATGKLGACLTEFLCGDEHELFAYPRCDLDICDRDEVSATIQDVQPEAVLQCAAFTDVDGAERAAEAAYKINAEGPGIVATACRELKRPPWLVHISSDFVFDGRADAPYTETDAPNPLSVYGKSKLAGEEAVRSVDPEALVLRTAWLFGGTGSDFVRAVWERARKGEPLRVVEDQVGSPTWVQDLALAIVHLLNLPEKPGGILHVTNAGQCSRWELARVTLDAAGIETEIERIRTSDLPPGAARPAWSVLDGSRFEKLAGKPLRDWKEAVSLFLRQQSSAGAPAP